MIAGYRGQLIASHVLEAHLERRATAPPPPLTRASLWANRLRMLGPTTGPRVMLEAGAGPLLSALGFAGFDAVQIDSRLACATARTGEVRITLLVTPWGERLDEFWRSAIAESARRSTAWCLLFNGAQLRIVHATRFGSRRFAEFDLEVAADDQATADALNAIAGASSFARRGDGRGCVVATLIESSDTHRSAVCRSLRHGVLDASTAVLRALIDRPDPPAQVAAFDQSLIVVYRVLFLLFAEARVLVPLWHPVYRRSYSVEHLRERASAGSSAGLWDALRALTRLAHAGCRAGDLTVTAFNGRLFAPGRTPLAERRALDDEAARKAVVALTLQRSADGEGREPIGYRDLGVEQLGAVYETLLDYEPHVERKRDGRRRVIDVSLRPGSSARKATGSFYTPQSIAAYLIRQTIGPLVRHASAEQILRLRILDPAMGSGAFLVAACIYLADAYESALIEGGGCHAHDLGPHERALIRRTIAERCLYGVDLNPMAVQLARLSLWLATLAADRPLSFLDHHLQVGDSLTGAWLRQLRVPPASARRHRHDLPLFDLEPSTAAVAGWLPIRFSLAGDPSDTAEQVRAKERALASLTGAGTTLSRWKRIADLWCAHWFSPELKASRAAFSALSDRLLGGRCALPERAAARLLQEAESIAAARSFFHWELEFPEVFFDADGARASDAGFDAIIGNPPWEMVRADAASPAGKEAAREQLGCSVRFTRESGVYTAQSDGHANRYQMFLERSMDLTRPGGRIGLVLPGGFATDHGSSRLRHRLFSTCRVEQLIGFDNRRAIFPIHRSMKFLLLTAETGSPTVATSCRFGETDPAILDAIAEDGDPGWPVTLMPALLQRLSGDSLAIPDLRSSCDLTIADRAASLFAPLGSDASWGARFGRELNATDDRHVLRTDGRGLPVVGGRHLEPFRVAAANVSATISRRDAERFLPHRYDRPRLAYRDVAGAANRVTLIAAMLPAGCVSTHTVFCLKSPLPLASQHFLCGLFNSLAINYLVRLRVATHVTTAIVEQLPIPRQDEAGPHFDTIVSLTRILMARHDLDAWLGLQATAARLYQLSEKEFRYVLDTFPLVPADDRDRCHRLFHAQGGGW